MKFLLVANCCTELAEQCFSVAVTTVASTLKGERRYSIFQLDKTTLRIGGLCEVIFFLF